VHYDGKKQVYFRKIKTTRFSGFSSVLCNFAPVFASFDPLFPSAKIGKAHPAHVHKNAL
jgi:hypothetical protein